MKLLSKFSSHERKAEKTGKTSYANLKLALTLVVLEFEELLDILKHYLTALDWLRQEELQEVPTKNGYFQIDLWI